MESPQVPLAWQQKACGRHGTGLEVETDLCPFVHSVKTMRTAVKPPLEFVIPLWFDDPKVGREQTHTKIHVIYYAQHNSE